jgi:hypothetical protein
MNIIKVLINIPKNNDNDINVRMFFIGRIFRKKLVKPKPNKIANGMSSKNFNDGTKIPSKKVTTRSKTNVHKNINLNLFFNKNAFI